MKKINFLLALVLAVIITGCSSDRSADVSELLKSVPSSTSMVAVVNLQSMLEKAGCKVKDGKIEVSESLKANLISANNEQARAVTETFLNNESGVDPSVMVFFADGSAVYVTGLLDDTGKFTDAVQKKTGMPFTETNGVKTSGEYAVNDNRFWAVVSGRSSIDPAVIKGYLQLSESQSFLSSDFSKPLSKISRDIEGWVDLNGVMNAADVPFQSRAVIKLTMSSIFDDAGFASFGVEFNKGEMTADIRILNSKGKEAKFLYPMDKVNLAEVESLGKNADVVMALCVPQKMIRQIRESLDKKPSVIGVYLEALSPVDGTCAMARGNDGGFKAVLNTTGENTSDLMSLLSTMGTTSKEGKRVIVEKGALSGTGSISRLAEQLKNTCAGVVTSSVPGMPSQIESLAFLLVPDGQGMMLRIRMVTADKDENILSVINGKAK